ncbi:MAG TPA: Crp/Fnr family transcriptional regulator [Ruania sp.]|nr:Crp/Fnr family transcriptional regulator [Ruania sp.]
MADASSHTGSAADPDEHLCVSRVPLFAGLSRADQLGVAEVARPTTLQPGDRVYADDSAAAQLMVVHTGAVKISRVDAEGREHVLRVLGPGDFVGESAFLTGRRPEHVATALETGSMCVFRHDDLGRLVRAHPSIGFRMLQGVSQRLEETEHRLASLISGDVSARVAGYLLSLTGRPVPGGLEVELPMAKKDVASLLDTTPESFSRQLRRLDDSGVVDVGPGRRLVVTDVDALMELSAQL